MLGTVLLVMLVVLVIAMLTIGLRELGEGRRRAKLLASHEAWMLLQRSRNPWFKGDAQSFMEAEEARSDYIQLILECLETVSTPKDAMDLLESVDIMYPWEDEFELEDSGVKEHLEFNPNLTFAQVYAWDEVGQYAEEGEVS